MHRQGVASPDKAIYRSRFQNLRQVWRYALPFGLLLAILLVEFFYLSDARPLSDESYNFRQISRFLSGDISMEPEMNVIPGYHALIATIMFVTGKSGIFSARFFSTGISFLAIITFFLLSSRIADRSALIKTLQFAFFPLLFPFFPLVYTDILGLLLVLIAFYLVQRERYTLSGLVGILSILARTNNIAWFAFLYVFIFYHNHGLNLRALPRSWKETWTYWLGFALFAAFLVWNGGIALTNQAVQPLFRFESGNIFFLLFLFAWLFLPLNLANVPHLVQKVRDHRMLAVGLLLGLTLGYVVYLLTFRSDHPYNLALPDYYIRNRLLMEATSGLLEKTLFFLPVAWALLSLYVTRFRQDSFYWLYPFTVLSLIPFWLIEPRYDFVPLSLFILFKEERSPVVEYTTIGIYLLVSSTLVILQRKENLFI